MKKKEKKVEKKVEPAVEVTGLSDEEKSFKKKYAHTHTRKKKKKNDVPLSDLIFNLISLSKKKEEWGFY